MVQIPAEDLSDLENDEALPCPTEDNDHVAELVHTSRSTQREPLPSCLHFFKCCFTLVGIWLTPKQLTQRQELCKVLAAAVILICICRVGYQNVLYVLQGKKVSSTNIVRMALNVSEFGAHFYCCWCVWRYEKRLAAMLCRIRCGGFAERKWIVVGFTVAGVLLHTASTSLKITRHITRPESYSQGLWMYFLAYIPLKITWALAMALYLVFAWSFDDDIVLFLESLGERAKRTAHLDLSEICRQSFAFKTRLRLDVSDVNRVFSLTILMHYVKISLHSLTFLWSLVVQMDIPLDVANSSLLMAYYLSEIAALSWAATRLINRLQEAIDTFEELVVEREATNMFLVAEVKRLLAFDTNRDALTIWDSFILCKATTVKFLGGMVSCVGIILQFDFEVNRNLMSMGPR